MAEIHRVAEARSKIDGRGRRHVIGNLAQNVEGGRVGGGGLALGGLDHDGHAVGQVVAEGAAIAIDAGVLNNPAVGDDKSIRKIEIGLVPAFAHRGRCDLLLEVRWRDQTAGPEDRTPFAQVVNVGKRLVFIGQQYA